MTYITLTTDLGEQDYYAGALKGAILQQCPAVQLIDITHVIPSHDIVRGAFILKNAFTHFPEGTIHLVNVHNFYTDTPRLLVIHHQGHFFLGPDNGIFSLVFDQLPTQVRMLENTGDGLLSYQQAYAKAIGQLIGGTPLEELGQPGDGISERILLRPVVSPGQIRGTVIHVDKFENVIVNVTRELFEQVRKDRDFALYFKRHEPITELSASYCDVPLGEVLCLFNSAGYLEIAIHMGKASSLLGLHVDDAVRIDFL
ncbi:MAG: SAM-dependent chlorinase/fluorinase [Saprospirales bacterium]|nr:SAM-dependent chlorinase/fluorinase [Saprospirales bacterium]